MDLQYLSGLYQGTSARSGSLDFSKLPDSSKLDDIMLVNARISYGFDYKPWRLNNSEVFLAVNNLFNEDYEYVVGYPMPGITLFAGFTVRYQ
jgi:iron complex outermembrane receptor protein